jgi:hypothetical protein
MTVGKPLRDLQRLTRSVREQVADTPSASDREQLGFPLAGAKQPEMQEDCEEGCSVGPVGLGHGTLT